MEVVRSGRILVLPTFLVTFWEESLGAAVEAVEEGIEVAGQAAEVVAVLEEGGATTKPRIGTFTIWRKAPEPGSMKLTRLRTSRPPFQTLLKNCAGNTAWATIPKTRHSLAKGVKSRCGSINQISPFAPETAMYLVRT